MPSPESVFPQKDGVAEKAKAGTEDRWAARRSRPRTQAEPPRPRPPDLGSEARPPEEGRPQGQGTRQLGLGDAFRPEPDVASGPLALSQRPRKGRALLSLLLYP